ncbi:MAG: serpin family protein [Candidatus Sericytochromatia bacterium]
MARKRIRYQLWLSLSLVYGCQATPSITSAPNPSGSPSPVITPTPGPQSQPQSQSFPSPSPSAETGLQIQSLSAEELQEVQANPLVAANNRFALKLFNTLAEERKEKNLFVSPLSVSLAFQMAWNGAQGETQAEMAKALEMQGLTPEQINRGAHLLMRKLLKPAPDIQLEVANAIFANDRFELLPDFVKKNESNFLAGVRSSHFKNGPTQAEINAWVNQQTQGKIPSVLSPKEDPIEAKRWEEMTLMYLINALYFKADWNRKFEEFETQDRAFTLADGNVKKLPMMRQFGSYRHLTPNLSGLNNDFQALELPYGKEGQVSMYLFLPSYGSSVGQMRKALAEMDNKRLFQSFYYENGSVILPKFKNQDRHDLVAPLQKMGMKLPYDKDLADFFNMAKPRTPDERFFISDAFQMAKVEVNEAGTVAAAVTVVETSTQASSAPLRQFEMILDRPFMYLIRYNQTGQILFMGSVYDPSSEV